MYGSDVTGNTIERGFGGGELASGVGEGCQPGYKYLYKTCVRITPSPNPNVKYDDAVKDCKSKGSRGDVVYYPQGHKMQNAIFRDVMTQKASEQFTRW